MKWWCWKATHHFIYSNIFIPSSTPFLSFLYFTMNTFHKHSNSSTSPTTTTFPHQQQQQHTSIFKQSFKHTQQEIFQHSFCTSHPKTSLQQNVFFLFSYSPKFSSAFHISSHLLPTLRLLITCYLLPTSYFTVTCFPVSCFPVSCFLFPNFQIP